VLLVLCLLLQLGPVQNFAKDKILRSLSNQYEAEWTIDDLQISFFDEVTLDGIKLYDQQGDTLLHAKRLHVDIGLFSLLNKVIQIDGIELEQARVKLYERADGAMNFDFLMPKDSVEESESASGEGWAFGIDQIDLLNSDISYTTQTEDIRLREDRLQLTIDDLDLEQQVVALGALKAEGWNLDIAMSSSDTASSAFYLSDLGWDITLNLLEIAPSQIKYRSGGDTYLVQDFMLEVEDVAYVGDSLHLYLEHIQGDIENIANLREMEADITLVGDFLSSPRISLETERDKLTMADLRLALNGPEINAQKIAGEISYPTLQLLEKYIPSEISILENERFIISSKRFAFANGATSARGIRLRYGEAIQLDGSVDLSPTPLGTEPLINADLRSLQINLAQLDRMLPTFEVPDSLRQYRNLSLSGGFSGTMQQMEVKQLDLAVDDVLAGNFSGQLENLDQPDQMIFDVAINNFDAKVDRLPTAPNEQIALDSLGRLTFTGNVRGTLDKMSIAGDLGSDLGSAQMDLALVLPDSLSEMEYSGTVDLDAFDLGTLLKNPDLDRITLATKIDGRGLDLATIDSRIDGTISDFSFRGYEYGVVKLEGIMQDSSVRGNVEIVDSNFMMAFDGIVDIRGENSIFDFTARIDTLNLTKLGFLTNELALSGLLTAQFSLPLNPGDQGRVILSQFKMSNLDDTYQTDSVRIYAAKDADSTFIDVRSDFLSLDIDGIYGIRDLPVAIGDLVQPLLALESRDQQEAIQFDSKLVTMEGQLFSLRPLDIFMPDQQVGVGRASISAEMDFENHTIAAEVESDSLFFGSIFSEDLRLEMSTANESGSLLINGNNNYFGNTEIAQLTIANRLEDLILYSDLEAKDKDALPRVKLSLSARKQDSLYLFSLEDSVVLNNKDWMVAAGNELRLYPNKVVIDQFVLTDSSEYLTVQSRDASGSDIDVTLDNFDIAQFATLLGLEAGEVTGRINGEIELRDINSEINFLANVTIDTLRYDSTYMGELSIYAIDDPNNPAIATILELAGPENDLLVEGSFNTETQALDYEADIIAMQMKLLDPFLSEIIKESDGAFSGVASISGSADNPIVQGGLNLKDVSTTLAFNNTRYTIKEHQIAFDEAIIDLGDMEILDKRNNRAILSGQVFHDGLDDIRLDVEMQTDEFNFLNTSVEDNPVFFGKLVLAATATIKGPADLLDINVTATTLDSSNITISPLSSETLVLEEDYITFGIPEEFEQITNAELIKLSRQFPFRVKILLDATDIAELTFVIDPVTGDRIKVRGAGSLQVTLHPDGEQEIFGTYTVSEGSYAFSYGDFISKDFTVKEGGTVRFNGNPLEAVLDIDAIYSVNTTTYELIQNEISIDDLEVAQAKDRSDVEVYLSLIGTLLEPEIKLDIQVPTSQGSSLVSSVERKLTELRNDPNELNSQVFSLLIFDRFFAGNSAASGFDNIGSNIALSSVSNLISSELNRLAENVIKGVDVNINIDSYDSRYANNGSGGTVTEVGLEVRKQLFNDRLSISAGGNIDINGVGAAGAYSALVGDFVLEYKLTENGRVRLRVFSKTDYDRLLNENTNRNGVGLFFNRSFDSKTDE